MPGNPIWRERMMSQPTNHGGPGFVVIHHNYALTAEDVLQKGQKGEAAYNWIDRSS